MQNGAPPNPNSLQQYHLNQLHSNSHANSRLSSSKPILGGGVAGSKYVVRNNRELYSNVNGAESNKHSPIRKDPQSSSSGINSKIIRESMSLNYSALKQQSNNHGIKNLPSGTNHQSRINNTKISSTGQ